MKPGFTPVDLHDCVIEISDDDAGN